MNRRAEFFEAMDEARYSPGIPIWPRGEGEAIFWADDIAATLGEAFSEEEISEWLEDWLSSRLAEANHGGEE